MLPLSLHLYHVVFVFVFVPCLHTTPYFKVRIISGRVESTSMGSGHSGTGRPSKRVFMKLAMKAPQSLVFYCLGHGGYKYSSFSLLPYAFPPLLPCDALSPLPCDGRRKRRLFLLPCDALLPLLPLQMEGYLA